MTLPRVLIAIVLALFAFAVWDIAENAFAVKNSVNDLKAGNGLILKQQGEIANHAVATHAKVDQILVQTKPKPVVKPKKVIHRKVAPLPVAPPAPQYPDPFAIFR